VCKHLNLIEKPGVYKEILFLMRVNFFEVGGLYTKFSKGKGGIKESYFKQTKIIGGIDYD